MSAPEFLPAETLEVLVRHGVTCVVIGGFAAYVQGSPLLTEDVDIVPATNRDNYARLSAALKELDAKVRGAVCHPGPVLVRVATDYDKRKIRWIEAVRARYTKELTAAQKARFLARIGSRALREKDND